MMNKVTNISVVLLSLFVTFTARAGIVDAYRRGRTLVLITETSLVATGGNVSAGSDASADCTVAAEIPVSNQWRKVFSIQGEQTSDVRMLSRKSGQVLEIVSLDVFGYCGLRSDFLGAYRKVQVDRSAINSVRAILVAAHEAALDASKLRGAADAASLMRPFAGLLPTSVWRLTRRSWLRLVHSRTNMAISCSRVSRSLPQFRPCLASSTLVPAERLHI
jgi:hypothetical protein